VSLSRYVSERPSCPAPTRVIRTSFVFFLVLFLFSTTTIYLGCSKPETTLQEKTVVPVPASVGRLPADFVICIDNSASIKGEEQIIIRETAMLLADLADSGDRVSVVTFGQGARVVDKRIIKTDEDRVAFRNAVKTRVDFKEMFSDIRACIRLLAKDEGSPIKDASFDHYVILLSDGRLEPQDRKTLQAYEEMKELLADSLSPTPIYAVVLGDTYCHRKIPGMDYTGRELMQKDVAVSADHFFHSKSLDQLFSIAVGILNTAKGVSSLGEKQECNRFRIDDSVESMTLIVRKKSEDGAVLCRSNDIRINIPESALEGDGESIYRSGDYRYFDLIVVKNPRPGIWSVTLVDGTRPEVLAKIETPLELKYRARPLYYDNESAVISAWIHDKNEKKIVADQRFRLQAHLEKGDGIETSLIYADMQYDPDTGQYYLKAPLEMKKALGLSQPPARLLLELIAQQFAKGTDELDPWFIRRSPVITVEIAEPFFTWREVNSVLTRYPVKDLMLSFGGVLDPIQANCPEFEVPPRLTFIIEHLNVETGEFEKVLEEKLDGRERDGPIAYGLDLDFKEKQSCCGFRFKKGVYRYTYTLIGVTKDGGPFAINSPAKIFNLRSFSVDCWWCWLILLLCVSFLIIIVIQTLSTRLMRLGSLTRIDDQGNVTSIDIPGRHYTSDSAKDQYSLTGRRILFRFCSKITLKVDSGRVALKLIDDLGDEITEDLYKGDEKLLDPDETHVIQPGDDPEETFDPEI